MRTSTLHRRSAATAGAFFSLLIGFFFFTPSAAAADFDLKPWPQPKEGESRFIFALPPVENEQDKKVELIVGKTVKLEPVNRYFFSGSIVREVVQGWGYPLWRVDKVGPMAGTLMAAAGEQPAKVDRFITIGGEKTLIRYNSKLPVVVYVPKGFEVRYRVWEAGETKPAKAK